MRPRAWETNDQRRVLDGSIRTEHRSRAIEEPLTALRHANGTLKVSAGPNRLIKTAHAEPEGQLELGSQQLTCRYRSEGYA